jgi:iron complex transport system ATP-binding protein
MEPLLKVEKLCGGYGRTTVIKDISLEIRKGEFLGIIGPNGSGKSTLLRLMSRALAPQKGDIFFEGQNIHRMNLKKLYQKMAFVSQNPWTGLSFSVLEMVLMGRIPHLNRLQLETKKDLAAAQEALVLTGTQEFKDKGIDELSSGERQRVMIAKALAQEPIVLLLDEPTSNLDIGHQIQILDLLKTLNGENNLTVVLVLHDLNLASEYCDRLILLDHGIICRRGTPIEVLTYQNIEDVYKTVVVVKTNPMSGRPYIILVPKEDRCRRQN